MGALAAVERFLERLFEGQSARIFRTGLRPIQVQRRIERAMETHRVRDGGRTIVPHRLVVRLAADDLTALRAATPGLAASLADSALAYARAHAYTLLERPSVTLRADPSVVAGGIAVDAPATAAVAAGAAAASGWAAEPAMDPAAGRDPWSAAAASASEPPAVAPRDATAVFVVPTAEGPRATIREIRPDRSSRTFDFEGRPLTIGRSSDNGLVLRDGRASRHHARIDVRRGSLVLTDLGSTNGSWVNDRRVESIALGEGDQVRIGLTTLIIEAVEAAPHTGHDRRPAAAASPAPSTTGIPDGHVAH
jgi:FhaA, N-terminal domain/FHA domain